MAWRVQHTGLSPEATVQTVGGNVWKGTVCLLPSLFDAGKIDRLLLCGYSNQRCTSVSVFVFTCQRVLQHVFTFSWVLLARLSNGGVGEFATSFHKNCSHIRPNARAPDVCMEAGWTNNPNVHRHTDTQKLTQTHLISRPRSTTYVKDSWAGKGSDSNSASALETKKTDRTNGGVLWFHQPADFSLGKE